MDIDNMHPFCLPFSLCHDATSSSTMESSCGDSKKQLKTNSETSQKKDAQNNNNNKQQQVDQSDRSMSSLSSSSCSSSSSTDSQQIDDLFDSVLESSSNSSPNSSSRHTSSSSSLLADDSLLMSSALLDDSNIHSSIFYPSLQLDEGLTTTKFDEMNEDERMTILCDINNEDHQDEWFPTTNCSLLSPQGKGRQHHSLLFQHSSLVMLNDSMLNDIKSSPTLAQLNLNSNDDPTDSLWDSLPASSQQHQLGKNNISNNNNNNNNSTATVSTSTLISAPIKLSSSLASTTALQQAAAAAAQQRQQQNVQNDLRPLNSTILTPTSTNQSSQQQHPPQHQQQYSQATYLCHQHQAHNHNLIIGQQQSRILTPMASQQQPSSGCTCRASQPQPHSPRTIQHNPQQLAQMDSKSQRRANSPELVSSSSSPPQQMNSSSSTSQRLQTPEQTLANYHSSRPTVDSKGLKENIDYLTALLCNGQSKISDQQQQSQPQQRIESPANQMLSQHSQTISSSMIKSSSYATLTQTLSTGPKLLERGQQHYNKMQAVNGQSSWFPVRQASVESSISAADSTAETSLSHQASQSNLQSAYQQQQQLFQPQQAVLSSLLSSPQPHHPCSSLNNQQCQSPSSNHWSRSLSLPSGSPQHLQHAAGCQLHNQQQNSSASQYANNNNKQQQPVAADCSIPPNGRPITLTPLISNNTLAIVQQQRQQQLSMNNQNKPQFVQPQSPSACSTGSSSNTSTCQGNSGIDIGSSSSSLSSSNAAQIKSSQAAAFMYHQVNNEQTTGNTRRPNSIVSNQTDCSTSLSSLDGIESFSSRQQQEQSTNDNVESDDEDDADADADSDDESFYGDYTNNDLIGASISDNADCKWTLNMGRTRRNGQKRFFWQYNVQSKGPKGARMCSSEGGEDPFVLPEASDPVFSNDCQIEGVKHSGKARRGDGNDLTPNPRKLLMIGLELKKLSKIINELAPVTDLPINARNKTRKEKNKLASRACRLKKKAQHEANKIKLYGLQREHSQVVAAIYDVRKLINKSLLHQQNQQFIFQQSSAASSNERQTSSDRQHQIIIGQNLHSTVKEFIGESSMDVAGHSSDYVNSVLEKVVSGIIDGGLQT